MINKWIGEGRVTRDIEVRKTPNEKSVTQFTLAVNRRGKDQGADFINCVAWEGLADTLGAYVRKGSRIGIVGRLATRSYKDKNGNNVYVTEVLVEEMDFLETKAQSNNQQNQINTPVNNTTYDNSVAYSPSQFDIGTTVNINADDLPF